jgi:hypothetical protein
LLLDGDTGEYEYLNKSRREVDGVDDQEEWYALKVHSAFTHSKFSILNVPRLPWTP